MVSSSPDTHLTLATTPVQAAGDELLPEGRKDQGRLGPDSRGIYSVCLTRTTSVGGQGERDERDMP